MSRYYDEKQKLYFDREPKTVTKALAALRRGLAGERREAIRCILVELMGHDDCEAIPRGTKIPHWFPKSRRTDAERRELAVVAYDGLLELGYDAAAEELAERGRDLDFESKYLPFHAKKALEILEAGPPSIFIGDYLVFKRPMHRVRGSRYNPEAEFLIARAVGDSVMPWYRFAVGKAVHDRSGRWVGWEREAGYTFQRRAKTLAEAKSG